MGTTNPENGSPNPSEPAPDLTDLLVIYHQHLIDQSRLSRGADAVDTPRGGEADSSLDESLVENPELAEELAKLEDCLWQLEQLRREEEPLPTLDLGTSPTPADRSASPAGSISLGARTLGRFKILRELGRGGLGIVFLAHDPVLNRHVALKIPRSESLLTPELQQRFEREAQATARLTHPNIVPVFEVGEAGPIVYIASAYVAGQSLSQWLRAQTGPVPVATAARIVAPLADAMHYAHAQGVLHRDLKPANVLLEPAREETSNTSAEEYQLTAGKITDFGLAKLLDLASSDTRSDAVLGTPAYMSPEQAEAKQSEIGPATDIYSLGVILYELLLGKPPYRGDSDAATLLQVMQGSFSDMRKARPEISADLQAICRKCLERDPAARYRSAGELSADLRRYLRGESTVARPLAPWQRLGRWTKRNPIVAALSFVSLALLLSVAIVSSVAALRIRSARDAAQEIAIAESAARQRADKALLAEQAALQEAQAEKQRTAEARDAADQQAANATQISNMLTDLFTTADPLGMARLGFRRADEVGMNLPLSELLSRGAKQASENLVDQPLVQATMLDTLGNVYMKLGQLSEADPLIRQAFALRQENAAGELDIATSKLHLGELLKWQGKHFDAEPLLRQSLKTRLTLLGPEHLDVAEASFALAWFLSEKFMLRTQLEVAKLDQDIEAAALFEQALQIRTQSLGAEHRDVALTRVASAMATMNVRSGGDGIPVLLDAISILLREDSEPLQVAVAAVIQGSLDRRGRDFMAAMHSYRKALPILQEFLGSRHPGVLMLSGEIAGTLYEAGKVAEAETIIREAIATVRELCPEGSLLLLTPLDDLSNILLACGEFAESEALYAEYADIKLRLAGEGTYNPRREVAILCLKGRYLDALNAMSLHEFLPVDELMTKARIAYAQGQTQLAEELLAHLLDNPDRYKLNEASLYEVRLGWAISHFANSPPDAKTWQTLDDLWEKRPVRFFPSIAERTSVTLELSRLYILGGQPEKVAAEVHRIHGYLFEHAHPHHWCLAYAESVLGQLHAVQGNLSEAEAFLVKGLQDLRRSRGDYSPHTRNAASALVEFYKKHDRAAEAAPFEPLLKLPEPIEIKYEPLTP